MPWLQPSSYHAFRCTGAECEDTCCAGWMIGVDRDTYEKYQGSPDAELGPRLRSLVTINTGPSNSESYARLSLAGSACPFLSGGLCAIQNRLGESWLSIACSKFPRVMTRVDDLVERSLDLACPEAARLTLLDPAPLRFDSEGVPPHDARLGELSALRTADGASPKPYRHFHAIRELVIGVLQYRAYPLAKRLVVLASFIDRLEELAAKGQSAQTAGAIAWFRSAIERNLFDAQFAQLRPQPALELELVVELIVARITGEFTAPRFFECYQAFLHGLAWTSQSRMEELGGRYAAAAERYLAPFLDRHGHMLEHYLVSYVFRTLFPLGPQDDRRDPLYRREDSMRDRCLLLLVYYAVIQTVLTGMAAFHQEALSTGHAIQIIQSVSKGFEHNAAYPARALEILAAKGVKNCTGMAILLRH